MYGKQLELCAQGKQKSSWSGLSAPACRTVGECRQHNALVTPRLHIKVMKAAQ